MNQKYMIYMYLLKARTFIALLLVVAFFSVMVPNFLTTSNLLIMTQHVAITGLLAIGMTLVILTGGIDLSVGAVAGICGMVAGALLTNGLPYGTVASSSSTYRKSSCAWLSLACWWGWLTAP
jgi:erythritol transport system permease protein